MSESSHPKDSKDKPVYAISVAADLVNMHPQTLRQYERRGLLHPQRDGKNRLYSQNDIDRLMYIQQLTRDLGVNLAGGWRRLADCSWSWSGKRRRCSLKFSGCTSKLRCWKIGWTETSLWRVWKVAEGVEKKRLPGFGTKGVVGLWSLVFL